MIRGSQPPLPFELKIMDSLIWIVNTYMILLLFFDCRNIGSNFSMVNSDHVDITIFRSLEIFFPPKFTWHLSFFVNGRFFVKFMANPTIIFFLYECTLYIQNLLHKNEKILKIPWTATYTSLISISWGDLFVYKVKTANYNSIFFLRGQI